MKILVVDDEKNLREALQEFLVSEGHEVLVADSGIAGLEKFKSENFDIVFMDIKMPGVDGIETFHQMKKLKPQAKVVVMTGMNDEFTFDRAASISPGSIEAFLTKPFKPHDVRESLKKIMAGEKLLSFDLTAKQTESLTRLGGACAENTALAFRQVLKRDVQFGLKKISIGELKSLSRPEHANAVSMWSETSGEIKGDIAVIVPWDNGLKLVDMLNKRPMGVTKTFDDHAQAALKAVGSMFAGACLNACSKLLGLSAQASLPSIVFNESKGDAFASLKKAVGAGASPSEYVVAVGTELHMTEPNISCEVLLIPAMDSLKTILQKLGSLGR